ncbi:MAG: pyruvate, phosphate dikinase [Actinomycetota bacterium]
MSISTDVRWIYPFDHEHAVQPRSLRDLLGGKGANLAEMISVLQLPVPTGFTVTTEACREHHHHGWPAGLDEQLDAALAELEEKMGRRLGDPADPLLLSVRSGAKFSMPGMMDTVLNLGLTSEAVDGLAAASGDLHFALDARRRFVQMFGNVVLGVDGEVFEAILDGAREGAGVTSDVDLDPDALRSVITAFEAAVEAHAGEPVPDDPRSQLRRSVQAVFQSWDAPRAVAYRRREHISDDLGTAVNVQVMVFGNRGNRSGTGVAFSRDPSTGEAGFYGDFLTGAQGEDVVAGIRPTEPLSALQERFPDAWDDFEAAMNRMIRHFRDLLDVEFTVEDGKLWMLQVRAGKRTGAAALKIACELHDDPVLDLTPAEAVSLVSPDHLDQVLHPRFANKDAEVIAKGLGASPGAAVGTVALTADEAEERAEAGESVILVRRETSAEDVAGMAASAGILTARGGLVSHAAVVARGWGLPAVVGCDAMDVFEDHVTIAGHEVRSGDKVSIDGTDGSIVLGEVELTSADPPPEMDRVLAWADQVRGRAVGILANADTPDDAVNARALGAEGIGLCRTEHQFLGDRVPIVRDMILAETPEEEKLALDHLHDLQRADFEELLEAMDGLPVTIRLLDPPLHEFLPAVDDLVASDARGELSEEDHRLLDAARHWGEDNPMLGTRGVRLGIIKAGLYRMQVRSLAEAAIARKAKGGDPRPHVMVPLVVTKNELQLVKGWIDEELETARAAGVEIPVGTMIETPRAAIRGDDVAQVADFFSFGTNDLTQMTFGFSRDDVEGRLMPRYLEEGLLPRDPFETIDHRGVGELVRMAAERGRATRPDLEVGVCGEHGGDPTSIQFFVDIGLDYVSCSPARVPVARLAAAQAVLGKDSSAADR